MLTVSVAYYVILHGGKERKNMEKWSKEKAWEWYNSRPWMRGFNFVPSDCSGWVEMWQEYNHAEKVETIRRELALAKQIGFNVIRQFLAFDVWLYQRESFLKNVEEFLSIAAENDIGVLFVLISDGGRPKKKPDFGEINAGVFHGSFAVNARMIPGIFPCTDAPAPAPAAPAAPPAPLYSPVDEPELAEKFYQYVDDLASRYAKDERVIVWNIWNEPGNSNRGTLSVPHMKKAFEIFRSYDPIQPLCTDVWRMPKSNILTEEETIAIELSDIISYHDYGSLDHSVRVIEFLRQYGRPMLNTEWLHRIQYNNVATHLPLYYNNNIGIFNWGFVNGKFRGNEPWEGCWRRYAKGEKLDIYKWQHDLLRPNYRPYDPEEIKKFSMYAEMADRAFAKKNEKQ